MKISVDRAVSDVPFDALAWMKIRGPFLATQLFLIAMAAIGQLDFLRLAFTYYVECSIATLCVVLFYSSTLRIAFQSFLEWIAKSFAVSIVLFSVFMMLQKSDVIPLDVLFDAASRNLASPIRIAAIYCAMQFSSAWMASRRAPDPKQQFFVTALYPASLERLGVSLLVMTFASALVSHFADEHSSVVTSRVAAVILTASLGVLRECFSYLMFPLLTTDGMIRTD